MTESRTWSFRPGDWIAVLGDRAVVALPPSQRARVATLWELVDGGAGFEDALDALIAAGLRSLPAFVLVGAAGDRTRVLVRGEGRVRLATDTGEEEVIGDLATTWVERAVTGVTRIRLELGPEVGSEVGSGGAPHALAVAGGVVRAAALESPPVPVEAVAPPASEAEPAAPAPTSPAFPAPVLDPYDGPPTEALSAVPPLVPERADHDGLTRTGDAPPPLAAPAGASPGEPLGPAPAPAPVARLLFSSGDDVPVDRVVLVGRAPEARRHTSSEEPRVVVVPSPHQEISSTHLEIRPGSGADHGAAVVADLGSTNGTLLIQPGLPPEDLQPGLAVQLIPGAVVDLGEGVTIRVVDP